MSISLDAANALESAIDGKIRQAAAPRRRASGTVSRVDKDGTVYAVLESGIETVVEGLTASVNPGDTVNVTIEDGRAEVLGNYTDPSAGVQYVRAVEGIATEAGATAHAAVDSAAAARQVADEANKVAQATNQHFFADDNGAHITDVTQDEWTQAVADEFSDYDPDTKPYHNQLLNSLGILLRTALNNLVSITRSAIAFYDGTGNAASNIVARFGGNGATIGKDDELQLKMTAGAMALENDTDDEVFSVTEDAQTVMTRAKNLVAYTASSEVTTAAHTVSDSLTASGAAVVTYNTATNSYMLDADYVTATVTEGSGVTVALTADGVDYIASLIDDEDNPETGTLSVEYPAYHYDSAKLDMDGSMTVTGEGGIIQVRNKDWSSSNSTDTYFSARNEVTGKELLIGVGAGGQNRGIYDPQVSRWLIYSDGSGLVKANADAVISRGTRSDRLGAAAPSSNYYHGDLKTLDSKGDIVFYSQSVLTTARNLYRSFVCQRKSSNGNTTYMNGFYLQIDNSGNPSVSFTSGGAAAWRKGMGISTLGQTASASAFSITSHAIQSSVSMEAHGYKSDTPTITNSGYYPLGVVGTHTGTRYTPVTRAYLSDKATGSAKLNWMVTNMDTSTHNSTNTIYVLWVKV